MILANSATKLPPAATGGVVICGSHGGHYAGWLLARAGVRAGVLHDAGVGRDAAGISSLRRLPQLALATVSHETAAIGDARAMRATGVISHCNAAAEVVGVVRGMSCAEAAERLSGVVAPTDIEPLASMEESRHLSVQAGTRVVCVDSASLVRDGEDDDAVIACGSHGGIVVGQAHLAIRARAKLALYNDAGGGAGTGRLPVLDERGIAAATVSAMSARIGDGRSTLEDGVLSAVNATAFRAGLRAGVSAREAVATMVTG